MSALASAPMRHPILESRSSGASQARVVGELIVHGACPDFGVLCDRVVSSDTRYIVFDLDRTTHLGRNLGELLGWELCALAGYGAEHLEAVDHRRQPGRFIFELQRPAATAWYVTCGARLWAYPGLMYLFGVKLGSRSEKVRPWLYSRFGSDPIEALQHVPRTTMMHHLAEVPLQLARTLARRIWRRYAGDQVVQAEHIEALRRRCPRARIILSSASPLPVVEEAARKLGVDDWLCTEVTEHDGHLSSPFSVDHRFQLWRRPRHLCPPSRMQVNAGVAKLTRLCERYPDFCAADVETVGITDNSYGEDGVWANHFKQIIDLNSPNPFSPIVFRDSPLRSVHSAVVLSSSERDEEAGRPPGVRASDRRTSRPRRWHANELSHKLEPALARAERLAACYRRDAEALQPQLEAAKRQLAACLDEVELEVLRYNDANDRNRPPALERVRRNLRRHQKAVRLLRRVERPLSATACRLDMLLAAARRDLD